MIFSDNLPPTTPIPRRCERTFDVLTTNNKETETTTTMNDIVADSDAKIAMIMAMAEVSVEEASRALHDCGGDVDGAMALFNTNKQPVMTNVAGPYASKEVYIYSIANEDDVMVAKAPPRVHRGDLEYRTTDVAPSRRRNDNGKTEFHTTATRPHTRRSHHSFQLHS